jgi:hypothetical protein
MLEHLVEIIQRACSCEGSSTELARDVDKLEVAAINVLYDIENGRRRLALVQGGTCDRATLLDAAGAATEHARIILKSIRARPSESKLAEARAWLSQARQLLTQVPGLCLGACPSVNSAEMPAEPASFSVVPRNNEIGLLTKDV